jgi:hypothetical protein
VGGAGARGGVVGVELRRTRLGHVQVRRDKAGASAGSATGGGVAAQGDGVQDDGVQGGHAWCWEELQCGGCGRIRMGAAGPRVENVEEEAAEGTALMHADHGPHGGGGVIMARRIGRRSCEAKATAERDELRGATV